MTIKVIGAGFGRTGTLSLKVALEELGFHKCYHMQEVFAHPAHAQVWHAASQGKAVDWDKLLQGYAATVDWPGCYFYKELLAKYPDAKVVLSVRDPEQWYASALGTIFNAGQGFPVNLIAQIVPPIRRFIAMIDSVIWQGTFHSNFADKAYAIAIFNQHIAEVKRVVPPQQLLVYEVKQGWAPLCDFLDVPVPADKPFPRLNDSAQFQQAFRKRIAYGLLAFAATIVAAVFAIRQVAARYAQRTSGPTTNDQ